MDLWKLQPGDRIRTHEGVVAEVISGTEDGSWIKARYIEVGDDPSLVGTEDLVSEHEVTELLETTQ